MCASFLILHFRWLFLSGGRCLCSPLLSSTVCLSVCTAYCCCVLLRGLFCFVLLPRQNSDERLDEDLRKLLKRLPKSTKRNLIQDLSNDAGGSSRALSGQTRGLTDRRASEPQFMVIAEDAPLSPHKDKVGVCCEEPHPVPPHWPQPSGQQTTPLPSCWYCR